MAMGAHDLAFEAESSMVESLCPTAVEDKGHQRRNTLLTQLDNEELSFAQKAEMKTNDTIMFQSSNKEKVTHTSLQFICLVIMCDLTTGRCILCT